MNLLVDTHVLLWWLAGEHLDEATTEVLADPDRVVVVSAASIWEIAIKAALGKLEVDEPPEHLTELAGFDELGIDTRHAARAGSLPTHHRDPFDRMLVAQSQLERLTFVTHDRRIERYDVEVLWV